MNNHPRLKLLEGETPIYRLAGLERALGDKCRGINIYVKRDDTMLLGGGGNKLRKLEFLLGEAAIQSADTIITVGGRQSNHARLTSAAAARLGLACELVLTRVVPREDVDYAENGNVLLDDLFGAVVHDLPGNADALAYANRRAEELRSQGRRVYVIPSGGSSPVGCLGYVSCALEIFNQSKKLGLSFNQVILANGSSGTHAGLLRGICCWNSRPPELSPSLFSLMSKRQRRLLPSGARRHWRFWGAKLCSRMATFKFPATIGGVGTEFPPRR